MLESACDYVIRSSLSDGELVQFEGTITLAPSLEDVDDQ